MDFSNMKLSTLNTLATSMLQSLQNESDVQGKPNLPPKFIGHMEQLYETTQFFISNSIEHSAETAPQHPSPQEKAQVCSFCKSPATKHCNACSTTDIFHSNLKRTFYCSRECQKSHWSTHKIACKNVRSSIDRVMLYRAANLLQIAYYIFRKSAYDLLITSIEVDNDMVTIREGEYDITSTIEDFPDALVKDKEPFLRPMMSSLLACTDQFIPLHNICKTVLEDSGLTKEIEEIDFDPKCGPLRWTLIRTNGTCDTSDSFSHCTYRVTMKDGTQYAIDLAGAQFGFEKHIMPWDEYEEERIKIVTDVNTFGTHSELSSEELQQVPNTVFDSSDEFAMRLPIQYVVANVAQYFTSGFIEVMQNAGWDIKKLLACKDQDLREGVMTSIVLSGWIYAKEYKDAKAEDGGFLKARPQSSD